MTVSDDAIYERLSELAGRLVEEPQHTSVLARILEGPEATFTDVSALAPPSSLVAMELLRIAALVAQTSEDVSDVERSVLTKLAVGVGLDPAAVDTALADVHSALATEKS